MTASDSPVNAKNCMLSNFPRTPARDPAPTPIKPRVTALVPQQLVAISPATIPLMGVRD